MTGAGYKSRRVIAQTSIGGVRYAFFRHPDLLISDTAEEWMREYEYSKRFNIPIPYDQRNACWVEAMELYEMLLKGVTSGNN